MSTRDRGGSEPASEEAVRPPRRHALASAWRLAGLFLLPALLAWIILRARLVAWPYGFDMGDEGYFNVVAWKMLEGWPLYHDLQSVYTPGLHLLQAAIFRLFEPTAYYGKGINLCTMLPVGVMLYFLLRLYIHPLLAFLGACYLPAVANGYYPGHVPVFAALLLMAWGGYERSAVAHWTAGLLLGLGILGKHEVGIAGLAGCLAATLFLCCQAKGPGGFRSAVSASVRLLLAALAPVAAFVLYEALRGYWNDVFYFLWVAPRHWSKFLATRPLLPLFPPSGSGLPFLFAFVRRVDFYTPLFLVPVGLAVLGWRLRKGRASRLDAVLLAPAIMSGLLMILVLTARDVYHLHSCRLPGLVLEAFLFVWGFGWLRQAVKRGRQVAQLIWIAPTLVFLAVATLWTTRLPEYILLFVHTVGRGQPGAEPAEALMLATWEQPMIPHAGPIRLPPEQRWMWERAVTYVQAYSRPGKSVFVAPGAPALYFFAERDPPTRFLLFYPGMVDKPHEGEIIRDLARNDIQIVAFSWPPEQDFCGQSFAQQCPDLYRWVLANFRKDEVIGNLEFYLRPGPQPLSAPP